MAKDPQNSNNTEIDDDSSKNFSDENWGEDWESAFQAEDYMFSPEEGEADSFFQTDSEKPADTDSPAPPTSSTPDFSDETLAADETTVASPDAAMQPAAETPGEEKSPAAKIITRLKTLFTTIRQRFYALRTYQQILTGVVPVVAGMIIAAIFVSSDPEEEFVTTIEPDQQTQQEVQPEGNSDQTLETRVLPENSLINETLPDELSSESEEVRQKWLFSSFFIPAVAQNSQEKITFVSLDLTLVVLLEKGRELPEYKRIFVRDLIYQFYLNQPLYELRRYSLARGEMVKKLHAWILKQWTEGSIHKIIINRYQIV
ncbi:MAG: hypothetical protein KAR13_06465 [Desulfobulbaceae bacterium]|nr:hypothetical protein [Desulfobulbaceae bacterium]